jgi:hypothetical protein
VSPDLSFPGILAVARAETVAKVSTKGPSDRSPGPLLGLSTFAVVHFEMSEEAALAETSAPSHRVYWLIAQHPDRADKISTDFLFRNRLEGKHPLRQIGRLDHYFIIRQIEVRVQQGDAKPLNFSVALQHITDFLKDRHICFVKGFNCVDVLQHAPLHRHQIDVELLGSSVLRCSHLEFLSSKFPGHGPD